MHPDPPNQSPVCKIKTLTILSAKPYTLGRIMDLYNKCTLISIACIRKSIPVWCIPANNRVHPGKLCLTTLVIPHKADMVACRCHQKFHPIINMCCLLILGKISWRNSSISYLIIYVQLCLSMYHTHRHRFTCTILLLYYTYLYLL